MNKVFEYMGWQYIIEDKCLHEKYNGLCPLEKSSTSAVHFCKDCCYCFYTYKTDRKLDGNDMVLAINAMENKVDWEKFKNFANNNYRPDVPRISYFSVWLFGNPAKFFELMEEALKKGVIGK